MNVRAYRDMILSGQIPPEPPDHLNAAGLIDSRTRMRLKREPLDYDIASTDIVRCGGPYIVVDKIWVAELAKWIGTRRVLEIMGGNGWLGKALSEAGVQIQVTDDMSWEDYHRHSKQFPVEALSAEDAVIQYAPSSAIVLVCWPPCGERAICEALRHWPHDKPVIYIGEGPEGCGAPHEFFAWFDPIRDQPVKSYKPWFKIHDRVVIGYYKDESNG